MVHSSTTAAALLGITALVGVVSGLRCFVCLPRTGPWRNDALKQFSGTPELLLCEHFHPKDKRYERDCPANSSSCLTQTNGIQVLRTCSEVGKGINDCKLANSVQYCYCSQTDLCNGNMTQPVSPTKHTVSQLPSDDEDQDLPEGSGGGGMPQTKAIPNPTTAHPPHGTTTRSVSSSAEVTRTVVVAFIPAIVIAIVAAQ